MLAELDDGKVVQRKKYGRLLLEVKHSLQKRVDMGNLGLRIKAISVYPSGNGDIFQQCLMPGLLNII
jgi:hypothetical protein